MPDKNLTNVTLDNLPQFDRLVLNFGLPADKPCLALMNYTQIVGRHLESIQDWIQASKPDPKPQALDYRTLFANQAKLYGVTPEAMVKFWPDIDEVLNKLELPPIPYQTNIRQIRMPVNNTINAAISQADQEIFSTVQNIKNRKS